MLREEDKKEIRKRLADMDRPVKLMLFTQKVIGACRFCAETETLLKEVSELSEKISLEIVNFVSEKEKAEKLLTPEVVRRIRSDERRRMYERLAMLLRGKPLPSPEWSPALREKLGDTVFSNRWYRAQ